MLRVWVNNGSCITGYPLYVRLRAAASRSGLLRASVLPRPPPPPLPEFKPKYDWKVMPENFGLEDYGDEFWDQFPTVNLPERPDPWIDPDSLLRIAEGSGFEDMEEVKHVCEMLRGGADTGVRGAGRLPQVAKNSPKIPIYGPRVMEVIRDWLSSGIICGPFKEAPLDAKFSPIGVVLKPTARARLLQDLSFPHLRKPDINGSTPISFNSGIRKADFPTMPASTWDVLNRLYEVGSSALIAKIDWQDAYKHIKIRLQDINLQWIKIGGRFLVDSALTFGSSSSPGIFDRVAELVLRLALHLANMPRRMAVRQLDDNVFIARPAEVWTAYNTFLKLATEIGVKVSPEEDGKAFGPQESGAILGFNFNVKSWSWTMDQDKATKIMRLLCEILVDGATTHSQLDTLVGKLGFYWPLFGGRFERTFLFLAQDEKALGRDPVTVTPQLQSQARWWLLKIRSRLENPDNLPDPRSPFPASQLSLYPDAAGGIGPLGSGFGAVAWFEDTQHWVAHYWPPTIRDNEEVNPGGNCPPQRLAFHTMFLEAVAALASILICPERLMNSAAVIYTDNSGVVSGFERGHSSETLAQCAIKACIEVAQGLNCKLDIRKVTRCSARGPTAADLLSKGKLQPALDLLDNPANSPGYLSRTLISWIQNPVATRTLGAAILRELKLIGVPVLTFHLELESEIEELVRVPGDCQL